MQTSLLPPNATKLERALEHGARPEAIDAPAATIDDPMTCPAEVLPWLAYGLSVDTWDAEWTEAEKREAVANSIAMHRLKGTRLSVEMLVARFDELARVVEWHQATPRRPAHTFDIVVPMVTPAGVAPGGQRSTAAFADAVAREVTRIKPLREHMRIVQQIAVTGAVGVEGVARATSYTRSDADVIIDQSPLWTDYLQTEDGEPFVAADGTFLETRP